MAKKKGAGGKLQEFDKDSGQYTGEGKVFRQNTSYREILSQEKKLQCGAQSGALNPDNEKDRERTERHAKITYERIRRTNGDIKKIAKVTGFSEEDIERIKNHMFFNEYELEGGKHRFDPDFYQAQSWDRLQRGEPIEADLILLRHEKIEEELMRNGLGYEEAHETANKTANYAKAVEEYNNGKVKKKRN